MPGAKLGRASWRADHYPWVVSDTRIAPWSRRSRSSSRGTRGSLPHPIGAREASCSPTSWDRRIARAPSAIVLWLVSQPAPRPDRPVHELQRFGGHERGHRGRRLLRDFRRAGTRSFGARLRSRKGSATLELEIRVGVHAGEVELSGRRRGRYRRAHRCARGRPSLAAPRILVSSTVKELVVGSGLHFEDAGEHEL